MPTFDEMYARITSYGWLAEEEARLLLDAANMTVGPMLEVGSYRGRSAMLLAQLDRILHCVDPWADGFDSDMTGDQLFADFKLHLDELPNHGLNVCIHRCRVEDWLPQPVGFAYLDGDHTEQGTAAQIRKALACTPSVVAMHDVKDEGEGVAVKRAAKMALGRWTFRTGSLAVWRLKR